MTSNKTSLKNAGQELPKGELKIVRPSKLAADGTTGVVASGIYEGAKPNKFNAAKSDYFIRGADNTLYIINETSSLKEQLDQLTAETGTNVEVVYNGKKSTKSGRGFHDFEVFVIGA